MRLCGNFWRSFLARESIAELMTVGVATAAGILSIAFAFNWIFGV